MWRENTASKTARENPSALTSRNSCIELIQIKAMTFWLYDVSPKRLCKRLKGTKICTFGLGGGGIDWWDWLGPLARWFQEIEVSCQWPQRHLLHGTQPQSLRKWWSHQQVRHGLGAVRKMRTSFAKLSELPSPVSYSIYPVEATFVCVSDDSSLNELFHTHSVWRAVLLCSFLLSFMCLVQDCSPAFSQCRPSLILFFLSSSPPSPPALLSFLMWLGKKALFRYQIVSI